MTTTNTSRPASGTATAYDTAAVRFPEFSTGHALRTDPIVRRMADELTRNDIALTPVEEFTRQVADRYTAEGGKDADGPESVARAVRDLVNARATESRAGVLLGEWRPITPEQYWRLNDQHRDGLTVWAEHNTDGHEDYQAHALRTASVPFIDRRMTLGADNRVRAQYRRFHPAAQPRKHVLSMDCWCKPTETRPMNAATGDPGSVQHHGDLTAGFARERAAWNL